MLNKKIIRNLEKHTKHLSKIGLTIINLLESDNTYYYQINIKDMTIISKVDDLDIISNNKQVLTMYAILKYLSCKYNDNVITINDDYFKEMLGVTTGKLIDIKNDISKTDIVKVNNDEYTVLDNIELFEYIEYKINEKYYVYRFINKDGDIIYVGRTVNLHNRMNQHFGGKGHLCKEAYSEVDKIEFTVLDSELSMVMCELYFINKYKAKYNTADLYRGFVYLEEFENLEWENYNN